VKLGQTLLAEDGIRRPVALVEGAARGRDGRFHVLPSRVGADAEDLFGGGVPVLEAGAIAGVDELAVDQVAVFGVECGG
jgi:hypothetical protein